MTRDNTKLQFCGAHGRPISGISSLFIFALLFSFAADLLAKDVSEKSRWAVKSTSLSELNEAANTSADAELETGLRPDSAAAPTPIEDSDQSDALDPSKSNQSTDSLANYDVTDGAAPLDIPLINVSPVVTLTPELRESLKQQFQQIQTLKETEDAFSQRLGESYLTYGRSLTQAGRTEESRKMLVNALHITKINNGVTSIEQRPILRQLFEMNLALGNTQEMSELISRIIWLEEKNPQLKDVYSFDMVVRLGNHYLDLFFNNPVVSELSLDHLNKATRYLGYAVNRYGDRPLSEILLPYGELALAHFHQSRIQNDVDRSFTQGNRQPSYNEINRLQGKQHARLNTFSRSEGYLKSYLRKAKNERDLVNTIQALLGLGDLNLLTGRNTDAKKYFDLAWSGAQNLPLTHPIVESFNSPVKLPSFNFSVVRKPPIQDRETELIALSINIDDDGQVRKVASDALVATDKWSTTRARRLVKRYKFRPIIENGKLIPIEDYRYEVRIVSRKSKAVASKDVDEE
jgi:tetratricopeptide (TPR) repeat protein